MMLYVALHSKREREREGEGGRGRGRERERDRGHGDRGDGVIWMYARPFSA